MELRECLTVRKAYYLVRQDIQAHERIPFEELAILAKLFNEDKALKTSDIAKYQDALRPTMSHRTNHLATCNYIERLSDASDRRTVFCALTPQGKELLAHICTSMCECIPRGYPLSGIDAQRMLEYLEAIGQLSLTASDLILLWLYEEPQHSLKVGSIVACSGMLQPTVSMSIATLEKSAMVERDKATQDKRSVCVRLTKQGIAQAEALAKQIQAVPVRKGRRRPQLVPTARS